MNKLLPKGEAQAWLDGSSGWERLSRTEDMMRAAMQTIVALCDDNERLLEALSDVMDWCTDDRRLPMDLFGVANAALAKHREVFGE